MTAPLLEVTGLRIAFDTEEGELLAVDDVRLSVPERQAVALVGESGSGKSVTAHAIMRLLPAPPARVLGGVVKLGGRDLMALRERDMRAVRGRQIGIVFQDPLAALNPVYTIGWQLVEAIRLSRPMSRARARDEALALLARVGFPEPKARFGDYAHQLSGGMRQRVMIAIALGGEPKLLIADEPTTALDMLAAAQIHALLAELQRERDLSLLLISHDIGRVAEMADQVVVLYAGQVVEQGATASLLASPSHPYTRALLRSVPPLRQRRRRRRHTPTRLPAIGGTVPDPCRRPAGCRFAPRCPEVRDRCHEHAPPLVAGSGGEARCWLLAPDRGDHAGGAP